MKFLLVPGLFFFSLNFAQTSKPEKPATPPVLTEAQKLAYYKAALESNNANNAAQQATQAAQQAQGPLEAAVKVLVEVCGKEFHPDMDKAKGLVCVANPEPVKPAETKK